MADFKKLLLLLEKELSFQEQLLELLNRERVAIVDLNQRQIEKINEEKADLIAVAQDYEGRREEVLSEMRTELKLQGKENAKFSTVLENCTSLGTKSQLEKVGSDLRLTAGIVREMNTHNATLIKQSLGLISSTLAIIHGAPGSELPTYGNKGTLTANEDPAFSGRSRTLTSA